MYQIKKHSIIADVITPIISYQRIRENYPKSILFESSEYQKKQNNHSIIVFDELKAIKQSKTENNSLKFAKDISDFISSIKFKNPEEQTSFNGVFGFSSYDAVASMESIHLNTNKPNLDVPSYYYGFFRFILVFDHFNSKLTIIENVPESEKSKINTIVTLLQNTTFTTQEFKLINEEISKTEKDIFLKNVEIAKDHCKKGNVFQIVISRQFSQSFKGDEFNVYRTLRSLNPSPYLFYADFGSFKLFGSSPEAQIIVQKNIAEIHPIAGTYKFTGEEEKDKKNIEDLKNDPKENSEHVMLVDLARNDLSRHCNQVKVTKYKEIQRFSHVIHLVSKVTGQLFKKHTASQIFSHTFPAGTLSGAPKIKAMEIIDELEPNARNFYGGAIGYFTFQNETNHAIIIRSFCSKNNALHYQAGAGIVIKSEPKKELQEIDNKLGALRKAMRKATEIHQKISI